MKKRIAKFLIATILSATFMASCGKHPEVPTDEKYQIYLKAKESGYEGTYEEWLESVRGQDGKDGVDGQTPYIGNNGNWWIGKTDTGIKAQGENGKDGQNGKNGQTPYIGNNGNWWIGDVDTGVKAAGDNGKDGQNGANGKDGSSLLTGSGAPSSSFGKVGDSYIDLDNWNYYIKTESGWTLRGNIKGQNGTNGNDGKDGVDGQTPYIGNNGNWWIGDVDTGVKAAGDNGKDGTDGKDGVSITKIEKTGSEGNVDIYTVTFSNNETFSYAITNGEKGDKGDTGDTGPQGPKGTSIVSITKTGSEGNVDSYLITYSDGTTTTFTVTNGKDGQQGIKGEPGNDGHTPVITIGENGNWYIDGVDTGFKSQGDKGDKGDTGLSAYEIYVKYHPDYDGTEQEWLEDLVNGNLREKYTVRFNSNGGTAVETQKVSYGHLITRPYDPEREGYIFDGWYLNGELFPFNSYQVYEDLNLFARWKKNNLTVTLDADGGQVVYNTKIVTYGTNYTLPTPTKENYVFEGWYYNETELCPIEGTWNFATSDISLKARWSGTIINISFEKDANISVLTNSVTVSYGSYFNLPVPTILSGDQFVGWATSEGKLITDNLGDSIKKSTFTSDVVLRAIYCIYISTPQDLLKLCSYEPGDQELSRTYIIQNDLDFTGLENSSIENFEGKLNGNGYKIIGLQNPLFKSVGGSDSANIEIENITFTNLSATCLVENANSASTFKMKNVVVSSFVKDSNDFANFYGIIKAVNNAKSIEIQRCFINDEHTTINCGLIYRLNQYSNIDISYCYVKSATTKAAFVADDLFGNGITNFEMEMPLYGSSKTVYPQYNSSLIIDYCANYGDTPCLVKAAAGSADRLEWNYGTHTGDYYYDHTSSVLKADLFTKRINISNCANYGVVEDMFVNSYSNEGYSSITGTDRYKYSGWNSYKRKTNGSYFSVSKAINFGGGSIEQDNVGYINTFYYDGDNSIYKYITNSSWMQIQSLSQVNISFFEQTIGLDNEKWDLSYIRVEDEYGRPAIVFN